MVEGVVVYKAAPSFEHGDAQSALAGLLRYGGGGGTGRGWWLATEVEIELETHEVYRPDLVGWRRERVSERPRGTPVRIRPDWVCEILSRSTAGRDLSSKQRGYHRAGVPYYWIVDPEHAALTVYRWHEEGYLVDTTVSRGEIARLDPFPEVEFRVGVLFGEDEPPQP